MSSFSECFLVRSEVLLEYRGNIGLSCEAEPDLTGPYGFFPLFEWVHCDCGLVFCWSFGLLPDKTSHTGIDHKGRPGQGEIPL